MELLKIMEQLRDPQNGCPWDLAQSHETLMPYLLEEAHEVREALASHGQDSPEFVEELGDLLFQVVFHAQLLSERLGINFDQIADKCSKKLIKRHPHVFDKDHKKYTSARDVNAQWEKLKGPEKNLTSKLTKIPTELPSLLRSYRIGEKASSLGFGWSHSTEAWSKVQEELSELQASTQKPQKENELGDLLFALSQWARLEHIDPEWALLKANKKFLKRFEKMEKLAKHKKFNLEDLSPEEWLSLWNDAKSIDIANDPQ